MRYGFYLPTRGPTATRGGILALAREGERLATIAMHRVMVEPRGTGMSMSSSGSHTTLRWRKPDSNSQSHPRERVSFGDKPTQIPKAMSWQTNGRRRLLAQDYDETAEDLEIGASEIRPPELLPEGKRPR
jgi:hypothetical protein